MDVCSVLWKEHRRVRADLFLILPKSQFPLQHSSERVAVAMGVGLQAFAATPSSPSSLLLTPSSKNPVLPGRRGLSSCSHVLWPFLPHDILAP